MFHRIRRRLSKEKDVHFEATSLDLSTSSILSSDVVPDYLPSDSPFLDYFMILGPHQSRNVLLFQYPAFRFHLTPLAFARMIPFCFPPSEGDHRFVFQMTDINSASFGICTHTKLVGSTAKFLGPISETGIYRLCSITRIPMIAAHFHFHEFIIDHLLGKAHEAPTFDCEPARCTVDRESEIDFFEYVPPLQSHPENSSFVAKEPNLIPIQFRLTIDFYYRMPIDRFELKEYVLNDRHTIRVPSGQDMAIEIASYGFDILFSILGIGHTVRVFRSVLLERKMIFTGSHIESVTIAALTSLVFALPMSYKLILLPFLPDDEKVSNVINSELPFCVGLLNSGKFQAMTTPSEITVVDLDVGTVRYPEDIPHLPGATKLRANLKELLRSLSALIPKRAEQLPAFWASRGCSENKKHMNLKYCFTMDESKRILGIFTGFVADLVREEKLSRCKVVDRTDADHPTIGFFRDVYMDGVNATDTEFFDRFLKTRTFTTYFERTVR
jgi:hypothetical protein